MLVLIANLIALAMNIGVLAILRLLHAQSQGDAK